VTIQNDYIAHKVLTEAQNKDKK